ncbi:MAG: thioredoxin-disulfide reductase [bacterium]
MIDHLYELIIIGGGPAGLAAGIYASRDGLDCLLFEKGSPGGQLALTGEIANYPGCATPIAGYELADRMREHAGRFGLAIHAESVIALEVDGNAFLVTTDKRQCRSRTVIVAAGSSYRLLGVPGEERFSGRGVSYCGSCDGPLFRDASLVVVGGGDTALEEALFLTRFAARVRIVHRRDEFRAKRYLQRLAHDHPKIEFTLGSVVREIRGRERVTGVVIEDVQTGSNHELACDGVFIFVGSRPNTGFLKGCCACDEAGYVVTDCNMRASTPGIFAAGDVRAGSVRQVAAAVGDGVTAIIHAEQFLSAQGSPILPRRE